MFANVVASQVTLLALLVQFYRGWLSSYSWSATAVNALLGLVALCTVALLIAPKQTAGFLGRVLKAIGGTVLNTVTRIVLAVVYIAVAPFAYLYGRRRYRSEHPQSVAWIDGTQWQRTGWVAKQSEADTSIHRRRSAVVRLIGHFVAQGNIFLLIITIILLIAVSLSVLTHTPYLAPFVYTLF